MKAAEAGSSAAVDESRRPALDRVLKVREVRVAGAPWLAALGALASGALLFYFDRRLNFYGDEWTIMVESVGPTPVHLWAAHNEHLTVLVRATYQAMLTTVGLSSYRPYVAVLLLLHAGAGIALFELVRRRAGDLVGLAAAAVLLLFGRGAEDLAWAFQIAFVGPVLCGLLATIVVDTPAAGWTRLALAAVLLAAGVMFSSVGLVFCVALAVELALDRPRRRYFGVLALPLGAFLVWFFLVGKAAASATRSPWTLEALQSLPAYVPTGIGAALAALLGLPETWGPAILTVGPALLALRWVQIGGLSSGSIGALAGALSLFVLSGLVRGQFGLGQAASSRYLYIEAALLLPVVAEAVAGLPWRGGWRLGLVLGLAVSLALNVQAMRSFVADRNVAVSSQSHKLRTLEVFRGAPGLAPDVQLDPVVTPITAREYFFITDRHGSPVPATRREQLAQLPPEVVDDALRTLFGPSIQGVASAVPAAATSCSAAGSTGTGGLEVTSKDRLLVLPSGPTRVGVFLSYLGGPPARPTAEFEAIGPLEVRLPDAGSPAPWRVRIVTAQSPSEVCLLRG